MNKYFLKKVLFSLLIFGSLFLGPKSWATKYAGEFLSLGVGARALAMGGAYTALASDATGAYWNPAGIAQMERPQITFMHSATFGDLVKYDYLGLVKPGGKATLGFCLLRLGIDEIPDTRGALLDEDNDGEMDQGEKLDEEKIKMIRDEELALFTSYALKKKKNLFWGVSAKLLGKFIGENQSLGIGFDVGCLYSPFPFLSLGMNFQDPTGTILVWDTGRKEIITPTCRTGFALKRKTNSPPGMFNLSFDTETRFEGRKTAAQFAISSLSIDTHLGVEYWLKNTVALRLGLDKGNLTVGAGLKYKRFQVDYAFLNNEDLGDCNRLSGSFHF
ncbi:MAG: PorV/PorQ family protein [Candidatus Edwardsbacteria bacterium]